MSSLTVLTGFGFSLCLGSLVFIFVYFVFIFFIYCLLYYYNKAGWTWRDCSLILGNLSTFSALTLLVGSLDRTRYDL